MAGSNRRKRHDAEAKFMLELEQTLRSDLRNLGHHIDLCDLHPTEPDGYKRDHGYDVGGSGSKWIVDEDGQRVAVDATTVEAAAMARARPVYDEHAQAVRSAETYRAQLLVAWSGLCQALAKADQARRNDGVPDDVHCRACKAANMISPALHWGNVAGRLDEELWLCSACYWFVIRRMRLPSVDEIRHHDATGRWQVRAS